MARALGRAKAGKKSGRRTSDARKLSPVGSGRKPVRTTPGATTRIVGTARPKKPAGKRATSKTRARVRTHRKTTKAKR